MHSTILQVHTVQYYRYAQFDITGTHSMILRKLHDVDNQIKTNEMGRACDMYGGQDRYIQGVGGRETTWKT